MGDNPSESGPEGGESVLYDGHGGRRMGPEMRDRRRKGFFFSDALKFSPRGQARAQRSAKVGAPGLVNFISAVAYPFCPSLPAAFTQRTVHLIAEPCTLTWAASRSSLFPRLQIEHKMPTKHGGKKFHVFRVKPCHKIRKPSQVFLLRPKRRVTHSPARVGPSCVGGWENFMTVFFKTERDLWSFLSPT